MVLVLGIAKQIIERWLCFETYTVRYSYLANKNKIKGKLPYVLVRIVLDESMKSKVTRRTAKCSVNYTH